jgi:hypothetical protein
LLCVFIIIASNKGLRSKAALRILRRGRPEHPENVGKGDHESHILLSEHKQDIVVPLQVGR